MEVLMTDRQKVPIKMWTHGVPVEAEARSQLINTASMPFIFKWLAVMPDVHLGRGATVGSVIPTKGAIIPAAVGVDIGCGMMAIRLDLMASDLPDSLDGVRAKIEEYVPVGSMGYHEVPDASERVWSTLMLDPRVKAITKVLDTKEIKRGEPQVGSLGGGNHFIEVCLDNESRVWVMLHSGSRGIGNKIGTRYIEIAKKDMQTHFINLPDKDLAYLSEGTTHFDDYVDAVGWAQDYAMYNRKVMLDRVLMALRDALGRSITHTTSEPIVACHHNYIAKEHHYGEDIWVTRKGAVRARDGEFGIIPGSMGARSFIVRGKGNLESFASCSHGAGRKMSRTAARERISLADFQASVAGVSCRTDTGVLDEAPQAYKDIDAVMAAQIDLVDIVFELKQVVVVKG